MKIIKLGNWNFFLLTVLYLIVNGWLFLLTTGGWSGFVVLLYIWLPFAVIALIMLIISVIRSVKHIKYISYNLLGLIPLVIFQLLGLLFNRQDCGDAMGSFSFLSYMLNGFNLIGICGNDHRYSEYSPSLWMLVVGIYIILIIISFFYMTRSVYDTK